MLIRALDRLGLFMKQTFNVLPTKVSSCRMAEALRRRDEARGRLGELEARLMALVEEGRWARGGTRHTGALPRVAGSRDDIGYLTETFALSYDGRQARYPLTFPCAAGWRQHPAVQHHGAPGSGVTAAPRCSGVTCSPCWSWGGCSTWLRPSRVA